MRIPSSTYRIQFNSGFTFKDAMNLLDYLSKLGITDLYASPIFCARQGSVHGYDVIDPGCINPEIGTEQEFADLAAAVGRRGMGWLQDIVPNHVAYDSRNPMLAEVFEIGASSRYYGFFDIEWDHAYENMKGRLLAPFLRKPYAESLESGEIRLQYGKNGFAVQYNSHQFPLRIESYEKILARNPSTLRRALGPDHPGYLQFMGVIFSLRGYPCRPPGEDRKDLIRFIKGTLWETYDKSEAVREFIDGKIGYLNGESGLSGFEELDQLLNEQLFRLAFWKVASEEINYRRFFIVNELISLKMEDPEVFDHCHDKILKLVSEGLFTGLRIDHLDGLYDPLEYLGRLRSCSGGVYTAVEKILGLEEELPHDWPVEGTTGYDYLNRLNGIFCRRENEAEFNRVYQSFTGLLFEREELLRQKKALILDQFMTGDVENLAHLMKRISSNDRAGGDVTLHGLKRAISEVLSFFPVYRTYISPQSFGERDRRYIADAVERAKKRNPEFVNEIDYLAKLLSLEGEDYPGEEEKNLRTRFAMRFQQYSGPLMAKGYEDTVLYVYNRLLSLNEVGGDPFRFGIAVSEFHEFNRARFDDWPHAMNTTSTHDTKRGEDARARINVLSEIPREWEECLVRWSCMNEERKITVHGLKVPSRNDEYFFYQTLIGAYPFDESESGDFVGRIREYVVKATREAKIYTCWIRPDSDYEDAFQRFVDIVLDKSGTNEFMSSFLEFQARVAHFGILNSLSQVALKICSPGVPDFYQGAELWDLSLVDPDNRRKVDFGERMRLLDTILPDPKPRGFLRDLMNSPQDGRIKLFVIQKCLNVRRRHPSLFRNGNYIPLETKGRFAEHVVAFARKDGSAWAVAAAPRFCTALISDRRYPLGEGVWGDTAIQLPIGAPAKWRNAVTEEEVMGGGELPLGAVLASFPVAQLLSV